MYLDIKEIKAITAKAYADKIGSTTMNPIICKIKEVAATGRMEVKIIFKDYPMLDKNDTNIAYLTTWARLCGYATALYETCLYIKWY